MWALSVGLGMERVESRVHGARQKADPANKLVGDGLLSDPPLRTPVQFDHRTEAPRCTGMPDRLPCRHATSVTPSLLSGRGAENRLLGFLPARLRPSPEAPQRQRGHAWAGASGRGAALPRGGVGRAARSGSAARRWRARGRPAAACCWQAAAGLFNTRAVISRTADHGRGGEGTPPRRLQRPRGLAAPRCGHPPPPPRLAAPAWQPPPPAPAGARERGGGLHMRSKPWQWECDPTRKGADCFASFFFFLFFVSTFQC